MIRLSQPFWRKACDKGFRATFVGFSFVMSSCLFPTGFSATLSTLAILFAIPAFVERVKFSRLSLFEKFGLALFSWLLLSIIWSDAALAASFSYLSEYRIYLLLPVLIAALEANDNVQMQAIFAVLSGSFVALVASYGLAFDWWQLEGAKFSLANYIFHGFLMSCVLMFCLLLTREGKGVARYSAAMFAVLVAYNVLNIETGRTGYLQVVVVLLLFVALSFRPKVAILISSLVVAAIIVSYLADRGFNKRIEKTVNNVTKIFVADDYHSSAGDRINWYIFSIETALDNPILGVGVGDGVAALAAGAKASKVLHETDNVHSEFMNMLLLGGFPALVLFSGFVFAIGIYGLRFNRNDRFVSDAAIMLCAIIFISALFNSTIKDYGEKHLLLILLSLLGARTRRLMH